MKKLFQLIFSQFLFWFIVFFTGRMAFMFYQYNYHFPNDLIQIFFSGFLLDWSAASYLMLIPCLLVSIGLFIKSEWIKKMFLGFNYVMIVIAIILTIANILLYKSWNTLLNAKALVYALQPVEMLASLTNKEIALSSICIVLFVYASIFGFKKIIQWNVGGLKVSIPAKIIFIICLIGFLVIGVRGGVQLLPVNQSAATFSYNQIKNDIATNNLWYLGNSLAKASGTTRNNYIALPTQEANRVVNELYNPDLTVEKILKDSLKPNIVFILLESWTTAVIEPLNGIKNITPFFTSLADSGLLFSSIYSTGKRTDQALPSVLCGFPAQPDHSIMRYSDKMRKLPYITHELNKKGYFNSYYYGGDLGFSNMHSFLIQAGFNKIISKNSFSGNDMNSKWGAHDEFVLLKQAADLKNLKQPFFSLILTLTSHEPFEIPTTPKFAGSNDSTLFLNAVNYTDDCLKKYFAYAKTQFWYSNTLFILMADHGHLLPLNTSYYDPQSNRIPLLFYGAVLKPEVRGKQRNTIGNQNDITATILGQLAISSKDFKWSNNLLNYHRNSFAYINYDTYFGWLSPLGYYRYNSSEKAIEPDEFLSNKVSNDIRNGVAYRQKSFDEFLSY